VEYKSLEDTPVERVQSQLEQLAEACLVVLRTNDDQLTEIEINKLRNTARAAIQRSMELPKLVSQDRAAWLRRTKQFVGAASRLLIGYLNRRRE
jgi:hypothetical protein